MPSFPTCIRIQSITQSCRWNHFNLSASLSFCFCLGSGTTFFSRSHPQPPAGSLTPRPPHSNSFSSLTPESSPYDANVLMTPPRVNSPVLSYVWPFVTPWTVVHQALLSMGFSMKESLSGLPFPPPGDLPDPGIEPTSPVSPVWASGFLTADAT